LQLRALQLQRRANATNEFRPPPVTDATARTALCDGERRVEVVCARVRPEPVDCLTHGGAQHLVHLDPNVAAHFVLGSAAPREPDDVAWLGHRFAPALAARLPHIGITPSPPQRMQTIAGLAKPVPPQLGHITDAKAVLVRGLIARPPSPTFRGHAEA